MKINPPHKFNSLEDIEKWRPTFDHNGMEMVDWMEVISVGKVITINSGLKHADGETLSPFHLYLWDFMEDFGGNRILKKFNNWYNGLCDDRIISK